MIEPIFNKSWDGECAYGNQAKDGWSAWAICVCFRSVTDANETRGSGHRPIVAVSELPLSLAQCLGRPLASFQLPVESDHQRGGFHIRNGHYGCDELVGTKRQQGRAESEQLITGAYHGPTAVACCEDYHRGHSV